ncbi:MAG: DUF86 domain-containing protein [Candidatus Micrarchaeota archaeon]|nr:DUF86 domain-containing protein [Candidatus Micrarchaeota archaeon]
MNARLKAKVDEITRYCDELAHILPATIDEYKKDFQKRAACERYLEKIVEAVVDAAYLCIKEQGGKLPEEDSGTFMALVETESIPADLAERLRNAKGLRNILAHEYGNVNDELVFHALTHEIIQDATDFVKAVQKRKTG